MNFVFIRIKIHFGNKIYLLVSIIKCFLKYQIHYELFEHYSIIIYVEILKEAQSFFSVY